MIDINKKLLSIVFTLLLQQGVYLSMKLDLKSNPYGSQNCFLANPGKWAAQLQCLEKYRLQCVAYVDQDGHEFHVCKGNKYTRCKWKASEREKYHPPKIQL